MNHVCDEKVWDRVLSFNFSFFKKNRIMKRNLEDDLEIFLYVKFIFYSFVFSSLSLYSVSSKFCFCRRTCDQKNLVSVIVNSVLKFICKFLVIIILFKTLLLMTEILLVNLIISSKRLHFLLSMFAMIMHFL